jgi:hypothetical protein
MSVSDDILRALSEGGPMAIQQLFEATGHKKKTLQSKLYELRQAGKVARSQDGVYEVLAAAAPGDSEDEDILPPSATDRPGPQARDIPGPQAQASPLRQPISGDQEKFRALLQDCDVKKALDTITETFFAGDPEDLEHLASVLDDARAYVSPLQRRLIVRYWARYIKRDVPPLLEERLTRQESEKGDRPRPGSEFVEDIGWKVEKDKDGDWVPRPGGELSYEKALKYAATMNATRGSAAEDGEEEDDGEASTGKRRRRGGGRDPILTLLIERAFPDKDSRDEEVKTLREELAKEREARQEERFNRLESMVSSALNRNPVQDYLEMKQQVEAIEGPRQPPIVTDQSPTVQLIKDQSDKLDKNMNRLVGILERAVLRGQEEVIPEEHSTPEERDKRAERLLGRMEQATRSRELRQELFGR